MVNNMLIDVTKCLLDIRKSLYMDTKQMLKRQDLFTIKAYCNSVLIMMKSYKLSANELFKVYADLNSLIEICDMKLSDSSFELTDEEEKQFIIATAKSVITEMCLYTGKFYTSENEFEYREPLQSVYEQIVDICIAYGYYFGIDKDIRGGKM